MSTTTIQIDDDFLNAQSLIVHDEFRDSEHVETPFLNEQDRVLGKGKPAQAGGARWISKIQMGQHSNTVEDPTGYAPSDLSIQGVEKTAVFRPYLARRPVVISLEEADMADGGAAEQAQLAKRRLEMTLPGLRRELEEHLWAANKFTNYGSLNGSDTTTGFLEPRAIGAQTNPLGGLSRSANSTTPGIQGLFYDATGSANANLLRGLFTLQTRARMYGGSPKDRVWFASESGIVNYRNIIGANERFMSKEGLDAGQMHLMIGGSPVIPNLYMPNAGAVTSGSDAEWSFVHWDFKAGCFKWSVSPNTDGYFGRTNWGPLSGEYPGVRIMHVTLRGQLLFLGGMNACGLMIGADTW